MKPKIGITCGWEPGTVVEGWPLVYANKDISERLETVGAIPVILPILNDKSLYQEYMDMIDGIIVSGEVLSIKRNVVKDGGNNPLYSSNPLRYENEKAAILAAIDRNLPLLGICRGHQVLNVEMGGTMKDGDITVDNHVIHQQGGIAPPDQGVHSISILAESKLGKMLKCQSIMVNSFHRQAVGNLPEGFIASAVSEDGNIEAIETTDDSMVIGLQFHPEMMKGKEWTDLFAQFVNYC